MSISTTSGRSALHGFDGLGSVCRFADDLEVGLVLEDLAQPDADEGLVVGDQDRRHRIGSTL